MRVQVAEHKGVSREFVYGLVRRFRVITDIARGIREPESFDLVFRHPG